MELTKNTSSDCQLSYKLDKKKYCKVTYLNRKGGTKELHERSSLELIFLTMSVFSLFHFVALMKILASIRG